MGSIMDAVPVRERIVRSRLLAAGLVLLRVVAFFIPLRLGFIYSLCEGRTLKDRICIFAGPWPRSGRRAVIHIITDARDWHFWMKINKRIRAARQRDKTRPKTPKVGKGFPRLKAPGIREALKILCGLEGGFRLRVADADDRERIAYLLFNHRDHRPPDNLLTAETSIATLEGLLDGTVDLSTAAIRREFYVHGNIAVLAQLEQLLPAPLIKTFRPEVYSDRTDHPLDQGFELDRQILLPRLAASCILKIDGVTREGNSFIFAGRGYDIYRTRVFGMTHDYDTSPDIPFEKLTLRLEFIKPHVLRLRCTKGRRPPGPDTPMLAGPVPAADFRPALEEHDDRFVVQSPELTVTVYRENFRIEVHDKNGRVVTMGQRQKDGFMNIVDTLPLGFVKDLESGRSYGVTNFELHPGEAVYGLGEHYGPVNKRGRTVSLWSEEGMGHSTGRNYKNVPFFMSTAGYGVFINEMRPMTFFVGSRFLPRHEVAVEGDALDLFFFYGPSLKRVQDEYTELTGKSPLVPRWSLGLWVSRISYFSEEEVLAVARRLRDEGYPADVIHIDTGWFKREWMCDWQFDTRRYPDPAGMIRKLHEDHFHVSLWQWPYVVESLPLRALAERRGALARGASSSLGIRFYHIDFSCPEGVAFYQELLEPLFNMGVDAIKTDFGEYVGDHMQFKNYSAREMKNLYPLLYNRAAFEIARKCKGDDAVLWARSAYAGSQRYPVHWSGDSACTFEDMHCALRGGLSLGLSGFSFWSQDVGGFCGTPSDALYLRWTGFSIFNSHMRLHGGPPRFREPWNYEPRTQDIFRELVRLRYRFMPYLYEQAKKSAAAGLPVLRHLVFEFQEDPSTWNIEDQFMFGEAVMVAPLLTEEHTRRVYLPRGVWYDGWSGERLEGPGWIEAQADLDKVPLYFRGGHAVVMGEPVSHAEDEGAKKTVKIFLDGQGHSRLEPADQEGSISVNALLREAPEVTKVTLQGPAGEYLVEVHGAGAGAKIIVNGESSEAGVVSLLIT